jgi:translocation and assembly module TamA
MERLSFGNLNYGVGAGIRFISPIGIVRVDGAFGLSSKNKPFRIHITMGPDL